MTCDPLMSDMPTCVACDWERVRQAGKLYNCPKYYCTITTWAQLSNVTHIHSSLRSPARVAWSAKVRSTHSQTKYMRARLMVTYNISRLKAEIDQPGGCNPAGGGRGGRGDVTSASDRSESEPDDLSEFGTLSCALIASLSPSLELEAGLWRGLNRCGQGKT